MKVLDLSYILQVFSRLFLFVLISQVEDEMYPHAIQNEASLIKQK